MNGNEDNLRLGGDRDLSLVSNPAFSASEIKARVLYADTDQMGVVNHATYLRWFEASRAAHMRRRGATYSEVEKGGIILPVIEANLAYLKPAKYDDIITVKARLGELGRVQLRFEYVISRDDEILVKGFTRHAAVNNDGRPTRIPDHIRNALAGDEKTSGGDVD